MTGILDEAYDLVADGDDLNTHFRDTYQKSGKQYCEYLTQFDESLLQSSQK